MADKTDDLRKRAKTREDFTKEDWENLEKGKKVYGSGFGNNAGTFKESWGGGKPLKAGEKAPSRDWVEKNRVMQPRDEEGKFTYNAVNLKDLKYGPSRGKTAVPIIKGELFDRIFRKKEVVVVDEKGRAKIIVNSNYKDFDTTLKEYSQKAGFGVGRETKKGRWSKEERKAQETARITGKPVVIDKEKMGRILKRKEQKPKPEPKAESKKDKVFKKKEPVPTQQTSNLKQTAENNKELIGQMVNLGVSPADATKIVASGKISSIEQFKQIMGL